MADPLHRIMPKMSLPELWRDYGILDVCGAVHDEFPGVYHSRMIAKWLDERSLVPSALIPRIGQVDFLRGPVLLSDMVGAAIRLVGSCNFALKWEVGRARPEEVAWKIKTRQFAPPRYDWMINFTQTIDDLNYDGSAAFTDYLEGSPNHPSWPAMHSAASVTSFWLSMVADLTEEQLCEARKLDYAVAYARTVAGVHYLDDNIAGLIVGEEILLRALPKYLYDTYGANKKDVRTSAKVARYNWKKFTRSNCYRGITQ